MTDAREYLSIQPMKIENHIGLKITSRSSNPYYTCEFPKRSTVAKQNYIRRTYQLSKCGYHSNPLKPYHELGEVALDSKKLILTTLGQEEKHPSKELLSSDEDEDPLEFVRETEEREKAVSNISEEKLPVEHLCKIYDPLNKGVEIINKVRLGNSLFEVLNDEKQQKINEDEKRKLKQEEKGYTKITMVKLDDNTDSDEDEERHFSKINSDDHNTVLIHEESNYPLQASASTQPHLSHNSTCSLTTTLTNPLCINKGKKKKNLPRPFSPIYTNLNFYYLSSSESVFRQLCVINWFLEAMAQDNNPPVMQLISNCWRVSDLYTDPKLLQRRIEREKFAEPIWQSFKANPHKFQYRANRKSVHHGKISIRHVASVVHFSNSLSSTSKQPENTDHCGGSGGGPVKKVSETRRSSKVYHELNFSKSDKSDEEDKMKSENVKQGRALRRTSALSMKHTQVTCDVDKSMVSSETLQDVPKRIKENFNDVKTEQAIILHDNLVELEKYRMASYEKKFLAWNVMKNVYESLHHFRLNSKIDKHEDRIKTKPKSEWFSTLKRNLHENLLHDKNVSLILKKLERFCDAEGRKISCSHFLRALSILRPFELCYPDISAGMEFVRDKVVEMDKVQFERWYRKLIRKQQRSCSAPPSTYAL